VTAIMIENETPHCKTHSQETTMKSNYRQGKVQSKMAMLLTMLAVVVMLAAVAVPVHAQTPTTIHGFQDIPTEACQPEGNIVQGRDGNMYGIGLYCGTNNTGAVYKISPSGAESVVYSFPSNYSFCFSGLILGSDGNFYGTCFSTPAGSGAGAIFKLTPGGVFTDVHDFTGAYGDTEPIYPPLQASDGNYYGVTGYYPYSCGNVYKMTAAGVYTNLHTFTSNDCGPASSLIQGSDGNLYGTLYNCSNGILGCVYKISTAGILTEIYDFSAASGYNPCTGVIQGKNGKLYGATNEGAANNFGSIYSLTTAGVFADLHDFVQTTDASCVDNAGRTNVNLVQVTDGSFYGVNGSYGPYGEGSIYKLTLANVFTDFLFPTNPAVDGAAPLSTLIQNTNGLVYGTTPVGGPTSCTACYGVFFSVATSDPPFVSLEPSQTAEKEGARVGMFGQGFTNASVVKFGGVTATAKTLSGSTYLTATVPAAALTGPVTVTTGTTTLTSPQTFKVKPTLASFTPPSGPVGTSVTITGTGLTQATKVAFNGTSATLVVNSDTQITATVPTGATTGKIAVTTKGGLVSSTTSFTVTP
jgi:uncharacterized repeat protein (TIGR03803 family)